MKAKLFCSIAVFSVVVLIAWLLIAFGAGSREPSYQGRTLSQWISVYFSGYSGHSPHASSAELDASQKAIRAIGTNAVPILIKWMSKDYPKLLEFFHPNDGSIAQVVFQILGEEARPAAPALIQLTKNKDQEVRLRALVSLLGMNLDKETLVPVLIPLIHDSDKTISYEAARNLADLDRTAAEKVGVYAAYPEFFSDSKTNELQTK